MASKRSKKQKTKVGVNLSEYLSPENKNLDKIVSCLLVSILNNKEAKISPTKKIGNGAKKDFSLAAKEHI